MEYRNETSLCTAYNKGIQYGIVGNERGYGEGGSKKGEEGNRKVEYRIGIYDVLPKYLMGYNLRSSEMKLGMAFALALDIAMPMAMGIIS